MPSALVQPRSNQEYVLTEGTTSIASSPVAAQTVIPARGVVARVYANSTGTTTGTITVAVKINGGSDICNGNLVIAAGKRQRKQCGRRAPASRRRRNIRRYRPRGRLHHFHAIRRHWSKHRWHV